MKKFVIFSMVGCLLGIVLLTVNAQNTGVTAEAIGQANLRTTTDTNAPKIGEIRAGTEYPVIGRSEFYPWLLLADPVSLQTIGWAFQELLTVRGDVNAVPVSNLVVDPSAVPTNTAIAPINLDPTLALSSVANTTPTATTVFIPTQVPSFNVAGIVLGEVNVRYGPAADYPRLGVAVAGDRFEITGYHTQYPWVEIAYPNSPNGKGWIAKDLLDIQGDIFSLPSITDSVLNLPTLTPTPSVVMSSNLLNSSVTTISPAFEELGNQINGLLLKNGFDPATSRFGAFFLLNLQNGEAITVGNNIDFSGTSVMKVAIMARLYESLDAPPDARLATNVLNSMICSENTATNEVLSAIGNGDEFAGAEDVTQMFTDLGLTHSFIISPYVTDPNKPPVPTRPIVAPVTGIDQTKANPDYTNQLSVDDMGWLLASMYQCAYQDSGPLIEKFNGKYEPRECRQMLHVMTNNTVDALLKAGVPADIRVAHKHGWIPDTHSNAAVFFTPGGDYVMVMMMHQPDWLNFQESLPVMAEASRLVYNYFNPTTPMTTVREGYIPEAGTCNYINSPLVTDLRQPIWDK